VQCPGAIILEEIKEGKRGVIEEKLYVTVGMKNASLNEKGRQWKVWKKEPVETKGGPRKSRPRGEFKIVAKGGDIGSKHRGGKRRECEKKNGPSVD